MLLVMFFASTRNTYICTAADAFAMPQVLIFNMNVCTGSQGSSLDPTIAIKLNLFIDDCRFLILMFFHSIAKLIASMYHDLRTCRLSCCR